ncbi:hypothetical protein [Paraburkholderia sp. J67]|uniref:hypothetical protein n=1 Tax=Paraburkholderia sp. J67 TaxID=2805435 RepID=UPI002ABD9288|nr:hypothetical protein [Paraburkholderia sp. J67]
MHRQKLKFLVKIKYLAFLFIIFSIPAYSDVTQESYCFSPVKNRPARIELRTYFDEDAGWQGAFVKYENSKETIPLVFVDSIEDQTQNGNPADRTTKWVEVVHGLITGEYEMENKGGNVGSLTYKNYKSQKSFGFVFDMGAQRTHGLGCDW